MSIDTVGSTGLHVKTAQNIPATGEPAALDRYVLESGE
jgi:hypothetical protein